MIFVARHKLTSRQWSISKCSWSMRSIAICWCNFMVLFNRFSFDFRENHSATKVRCHNMCATYWKVSNNWVLQYVYFGNAERSYRNCIKFVYYRTFIWIVQSVYVETAVLVWILQNGCMNTAERLYEYCRMFVWILQNVCMNTAECLYEYCRTCI
jgi:hypothetical protein